MRSECLANLFDLRRLFGYFQHQAGIGSNKAVARYAPFTGSPSLLRSATRTSRPVLPPYPHQPV